MVRTFARRFFIQAWSFKITNHDLNRCENSLVFDFVLLVPLYKLFVLLRNGRTFQADKQKSMLP